MEEYRFVKDPPNDYLCMICAKVLDEPNVTDCCGQHFCQACLEQWFEAQGKKLCPHCRSESFSYMRYLPLKRKINELQVYCSYQKQGCEKITTLGELKSHMRECGFAKVLCSQLCGETVLRKDLKSHCRDECQKRKIKCKFCGEEDHFEIIEGEHMRTCKEHPVSCPKKCGQDVGLVRKNLAEHANICPNEQVRCLFHDAGCDEVVLRKDLTTHLELNTQVYLIKMMAAYSNLKEEFSQLSSQVVNLTLAEPVKLTERNNTFTFSIISSDGWVSPPFFILDGYKFCIKHKGGNKVCLLLLKGEYDDKLQWPIYLPYELKVWLDRPREKVQQPILKFNLFDPFADLDRVALGSSHKELTLSQELRFDKKELQNCMKVKLCHQFNNSWF